MGNFFDVILIHPIINILVVIYTLLSGIGLPYALGFSIIGLTIVLRFLISPLTASQLKASKKMQDLTPHLTRLKDQHKGDSQRLQQETMRLYKEHGVNPAAGCLPLLIQLPIFYALYNVLIRIVNTDTKTTVETINNALYFPALHLSKPWDPTFFGIPLGATPSKWSDHGIILLAIPVVTAVLQYMQSKMMAAQKDPQKKQPETKDKTGESKQSGDDFQAAMQTQMLYFMPIMIGFFSYTFPIGLSLYWNTYTIFGILQQYKLHGWGGFAEHLPIRQREPIEQLAGRGQKKR